MKWSFLHFVAELHTVYSPSNYWSWFMAKNTFHLCFWLLSSWNYCESFSRGMLYASLMHISLILEVEGNHDLCLCFFLVPELSNLCSDFFLLQRLDWSSSSSASSQKDCILLAACEAHQTLPQSAEFPADVFTACLTTPIKMALHWFSPSLSDLHCLYFFLFNILCLHGFMPINYAGFVNDHYSEVLWIILL